MVNLPPYAYWPWPRSGSPGYGLLDDGALPDAWPDGGTEPSSAWPFVPPAMAPSQPPRPDIQSRTVGFNLRPDPIPGFTVGSPSRETPGFRVGADGPPADAPPAWPNLAAFGLSGDDPASAALYSALGPSYIPPPRDRAREAVDQILRIYAGHGLDRLEREDSRRSGFGVTEPARFEPADYTRPAGGDGFNPQHVVPVNRPPPPPGDNSRAFPRPAPATPSRPAPAAPPPPRPPAEQPPPDTVGPAAAVDAAAQRRLTIYNTYREQLQALDPENPLLKLEQVPDVPIDHATVERYGNEIKRVVREKVDKTAEDLRARSVYEKRSSIRTIGGDADLRAEFDRLKVGGRRVYGQRGQYGVTDHGELYELPGGLRIGFSMARDTRTGVSRSLPTLDIMYPDRRNLRFHYNNER